MGNLPASKKGNDGSASPFMTTREVAAYLRLTERTIKKMRSEGTGPNYRKHGGHVLYHKDDVDAWSEDHAYESTGGAGL